MVSEAGKTLKLLKSSEVHRLAYLLKNAHAIAKQNRPLTDYKWLCQVAKFKGLDIGNTYQTDHAARDSIDCIAKYERVFNGDAKYVVAFFFFFSGQTNFASVTVFLNCLTVCQTSCLGFSICLTLDLLLNTILWISECCLMPTQQFFSYIMVRNR